MRQSIYCSHGRESKDYKGFVVSLDPDCSQYHVQMKIFGSLYGRKKSLTVWKGVMDMDECLPLVCENKLSFSVDLAADSKSVYGWRSAHSRGPRMQGRKLLNPSCVNMVDKGALNHRHDDAVKMEMCVCIFLGTKGFTILPTSYSLQNFFP